jgi:hypothetical protein
VFQSDDYSGHIIIIIIIIIVIVTLQSFKELAWRMWLSRSSHMQVFYGTFLLF